jgi:hypothetical protein
MRLGACAQPADVGPAWPVRGVPPGWNDTYGYALTAHPDQSQGQSPANTGSQPTVDSGVSTNQLFDLDPVQQIVRADRLQQRWMVGCHVVPDHANYLIIALAAGHEPALASDQLHPTPSRRCTARWLLGQLIAKIWA